MGWLRGGSAPDEDKPERRIGDGGLALSREVSGFGSEHLERHIDALIHNALRHTPKDAPVTVDVRAVEAYVHISIDDRGPGFSADLKLQAFEDFVQGPEAAVAASPGTGIGLSLAQRLSRLNGGEIAILDREGGGSRVQLRLPTA